MILLQNFSEGKESERAESLLLQQVFLTCMASWVVAAIFRERAVFHACVTDGQMEIQRDTK